MKTDYLIIGNGMAGTEAAENIRKLKPSSSITILSQSSDLFYYRPRLIDYLAGKTDLQKITVHSADWYEENNINLMMKTKAEKIDPDAKEVFLNGGKVISYDKLLISTGARSFIPPVKNNTEKGVFGFRSRQDADEIIHNIHDQAKVFVIGGGLLGLETAYSLVEKSAEVTVVECFDRLLPRQLDHEGALILKTMLESKGLQFILNDMLQEIDGQQNPEKIILKSGQLLACDTVIFSAGVRARTELAEKAGINVNKGIIVDNCLQTNITDIYAAGDCAEHQDQLYGLWIPAKEQGKAAGLNMIGEKFNYNGTPLEARLKVAGISLFSAGHIEEDSSIELKKVHSENSYRKFFFKEQKLVGAITIGDNKAALAASRVLKGQADISILDPFYP